MIKSHVFSYTDIFVFPKKSLKAVTCDALKFSLQVWQLQGHLAATVYHTRSSCWGDTSASFCPWRPCLLISWEMWLSGLRLCEDQVLEMMAAAWSNCRATAAPSVKIPAHLIQPHVLWFGGPLYKQMADTMKELGHPRTSNRKCDIYICTTLRAWSEKQVSIHFNARHSNSRVFFEAAPFTKRPASTDNSD